MSPKIKLTYFTVKGRGEPTRLALHIAGVPFEDERVELSSFKELKPGVLFGQLPQLTVDGRVFSESNAMLRYAGKLAGLYPKNEEDALAVDMVVDVMETVGVGLYMVDSKEERKKWASETVPRFVSVLDKLYAEKSGPFLLGDQLTIADIKLMVVLEGANDGKTFKYVPKGVLDKYTRILAAAKAVAANEKVKEWNAMHE